MVEFITTQNGAVGFGVYVAVPVKPVLDEILQGSSINDKLFPYRCNQPEYVDARIGLVEGNGVFSDVVITYSNDPQFHPQIYKLPKRSLEGYTTLHVSSRSINGDVARQNVQEVLGLFSEVVDLEMRKEHNDLCLNSLSGLVNDFSYQIRFLEKYTQMRDKLSEVNRVPNKKIERGPITCIVGGLLNNMGKRIALNNAELRLVNRFQGNYQGLPLEVSLLFLTGDRISPGVYGAMVYKKHDKECPEWEVDTCDQARSYAGYLLNSSSFVFGGSNMIKGVRRINSRSMCVSGGLILPNGSSPNLIQGELRSLRNMVESSDEVSILAQLVSNI